MTRLSVDDSHTVTTLPGSSMRNFKQKDDDCISENSFGSDFGGNATDEEDLIGDSPPPVYSEGEYPQSMFLLANKDVKSPPVVLQYTPPTGSAELEPPFSVNFSGPSMCVVCKVSPAYSKDGLSYPTCRSLTCASQMRKVPITSLNFLPQHQIPPPPASFSYSVRDPSRPRGSVGQMKMCDVCHVRPRFKKAGKSYPTCGLTCAAALKSTGSISNGNAPTFGTASTGYRCPNQVHQPCVVCLVNPRRDGRFVTCGMKCTEIFCRRGSSIPGMCDYCHRRPKAAGHSQCGKTCRDNSRTACLLCRRRPKFGRYPLCGRTCKNIATKWTRVTPLILQALPGHTIYNEVEQRFKRAWKGNGVCPSIKKIYKVIENKSSLLPYDQYKKRVGNEAFRYYGVSRGCALGSPGNTQLCSSMGCALCSVLRMSFKVSQSGAFGAGIYTSSTANKAYSYSNGSRGAIILTKVVLGTVYNAKARYQVKSCPPGCNSVVFNGQDGKLDNTTVVYTDNAIRPVFLIIF